MTTVLAVSALIVTGTMVGVELGVASVLNPILDRLPADGRLAARSDGAGAMGRLMPWWYALSLALSVVLTVVLRDAVWVWIAAAGAALLATSIVLSVTALVPINNRIASWAPGTPPADWQQQLRRWDRRHHVRVALILVGFACVATGAVLGL